MDRSRILVVDPDENTGLLLEQQVNGNCELLAVPQGKRALELARQGRVHVALVARCLPDMEGLDLLKQLKREAPRLPVIFLAASPDEDLVLSAFRAGARDFFKKPFDAVELKQSLLKILEFVNGNDQQNGHASGHGRLNWAVFVERLQKRWSAWGSRSRRTRNGRAARSATDAVAPSEKGQAAQTVAAPPVGPQPSLRVNFLGRFHFIFDEHVVDTWPNKKSKAVFAYLAYHHKRRVVRDALMDLFWPNATPDSARNCLNVALHAVRQRFHALQPDLDVVLFRDECYFLNPELNITLDVEDFLQHWRVAQSLEREKGLAEAVGEYEMAAALYTGDFMEEDLYEDWCTLDRENLKEIYLLILDRLSAHYSSLGKCATAVALCQNILAKDNCREDIHQRLMRCYYRLGQRDKALKQFHKCREILLAELEVEPTRTTCELYEQIKADALACEPEETL